VFAVGGCEALLHEIGHLFEGPSVEESGVGLGWVAGTRVTTSSVTIVDDPARGAGARGHYRRDDQGDSPVAVTLIEAGRLVGRIASLAPSIHGGEGSGAISTGHARRGSYRDLPLPRMACTILEPGPDDPASIVSGTARGLLVRRLGSSSIDPESGRVTLSVVEGSLIERGEVTHPIAPSLIAGDVHTMLQSIDAVGSDLTFDDGATNCVKADQHLPVMVGLPTLRMGMIRVFSPIS